MVAFFIAMICGWPSIVVGQDADGTAPEAVDLITGVPVEAYPAAVGSVTAADIPNDDGGSILVKWKTSTDDSDDGKVTGYKIMRAIATGGQVGEFSEVGDVPRGVSRYADGNADDDLTYVYKVHAVNLLRENGEILWTAVTESATTEATRSSAQWFHWKRVNVLVGVALLCAFIVFYIQRAKAGKTIFIRRIAGLEAVDEAVGRATEMGKKIFYIPGTQDMDNVQTIAGVSILGHVAGLAAQYETYLEVPVARSLVLVTATEVVKEAYSKVGRPDAFQSSQVHYLTDDQFGYAAAVDGMVVREKPAAIFYMGAFYAESLILAETGNATGAIQIAGTAMPMQLPFFVAACDYTLIGEELFAASAYLSKEPRMLGSLKGQDVGKGVILACIFFGVLLETFGIWDFSQLFSAN